jgi:4-hydroxy-tetrahydrodipicolinate reductase
MRSSGTEREPLPLSFALVGFGRIGRAIEEVALARGHRILSVIHPTAAEPCFRRITGESLRKADVAMEFTGPDSAVGNIIDLAEAGCRSVVVGSTGWKGRLTEVERIVAGRGLGLLHANNFSIGMAMFSRIVTCAAELLVGGEGRGGYEPYVLEWHHRGKRDAPSGTARTLASILQKSVPSLVRHEDDVKTGLPPGTFQVASVRAGAIPGTHLVGFESEGDAIELRHVARGRSGFALGAVLAAEWLHGRSGMYTLDDLLEGML